MIMYQSTAAHNHNLQNNNVCQFDRCPEFVQCLEYVRYSDNYVPTWLLHFSPNASNLVIVNHFEGAQGAKISNYPELQKVASTA